jgi:trimethylamine--corrinoid protein Co-methyltransferase
MKSGAPAFGTPEYAKATLASGQLARRYNLPFRASNATASNAPDAQSVYEAAMSVWPCVLAHCNIVKHGLGWLEGGLCASYEKVILDAEMLQLIAAFLEPIETDQDSLGIEAMAEVGPGSHFFQAAHTMARYEHAFYTPLLSDWRNYETWQDDGALDATMRANRIWKQLLADYEPPPMDEGVAEEIAAFVAKRKEQGGVLDR